MNKRFFLSSIAFCISIFSLFDFAQAEEVANFSEAGLNVALSAKSDALNLSIKGSAELAQPEILVLENPSRFVVDILGASSKSSKTYNTNSALVKALRTGIHADKLRIVLDLKTNVKPEFKVRSQGSNAYDIELSFSGSNQDNLVDDKDTKNLQVVSTTIKKTTITSTTSTTTTTTSTTSTTLKKEKTTTTSSISATSTTTTSTTTLVKKTTTTLAKSGKNQTSEELVNSQTQLSPELKDNAKINKVSSGSVVKSIYFQVTENTKLPALTFQIPGLKSYFLDKQSPFLYLLTLEDTSLAETHLSLPQFPPETFKGFTVVTAKQEGSKVMVKIYVEENTKLFPFINKDELWIKVAE